MTSCVSTNDRFGWIDQVIHQHRKHLDIGEKRRGGDCNDKERRIGELMEENGMLKRRLEQYENGVLGEDLKMRIGELEDEKREMYMKFKEIDLLKEKEIRLLIMNKMEGLKDVVNDGIENLRKVIEEKEHLAQFLLVINGFFGRINHYIKDCSEEYSKEESDVKILERKCNIIEGILREGCGFNSENIRKGLDNEHYNSNSTGNNKTIISPIPLPIATSHIGEFQENAIKLRKQSKPASQNNSYSIPNSSSHSVKRRKYIAQPQEHK